jgi:hypothetical protein
VFVVSRCAFDRTIWSTGVPDGFESAVASVALPDPAGTVIVPEYPPACGSDAELD